MPRRRPLARLATIVPVLTALALVGCGSEVTDVSEGVDEFRDLLAPAGIDLNCPDEVDGGEGTTFDCTLEARESKASETVTMVIVNENDELVVGPNDEQEFEQAIDDLVAG